MAVLSKLDKIVWKKSCRIWLSRADLDEVKTGTDLLTTSCQLLPYTASMLLLQHSKW